MRTMEDTSRQPTPRMRGKNCCWALMALAGAASTASAQFTDLCTSAPSNSEGVFTFNLTSATSGPVPFEPGCADDTQPFIDQWLRYVPTATGSVVVSTLGLSTGDTVLTAHTDGTCAEPYFSVIACNNDSGGTPQSRIQIPVTAGEAVLIRVAGAFQSRPTGSVRIEAVVPLPIGDTCDDPAPATSGVNVYDASRSAQDTYLGCNGFRDVWFEYTPTQSGGLTVATCPGGVQAEVAIYSDCGGYTLACSGYEACSASTVVEAGVPVLIRIADDEATGPSQFTLSLDPNAIPANDECEGALPAGLGNTAFDNTFATSGDIIACNGGTFSFESGNDLYYTFTPAATGTYDVSTEQSPELTNTILAMYDSCGGLPFACNDDSRGFLSFIRFDLVGGQGYTILVAGAGIPGAGTPIDRGDGILSIRRSIPPLNDTFDTAQTIGAGVTSYDLYDATTGGPTPDCVPQDRVTRNDVWFRYVPTSTGVIEASLDPSGAAASLAAFADDETVTPLSTAGRTVDPTTGVFASRLLLNVQAGEPILLRVALLQYPDETLPASGSGTITVGPPTTPTYVNDRCADALPLAAGETFVDLTGSVKDCSDDPSPEFDACAAVTDNDRFYAYESPATETVVIAIDDGLDYPNFGGLTASVYAACGESPIACSFAIGDAPANAVQFQAQAGETYIVRVGSLLAFGFPTIEAGSIIVNPQRCGSVDFDGDGDEGTDADIEAFFSAIGGGPCPTGTCGSIDFDGDGDEGTDQDIESFFRRLSGGPC